MTDRVVRLINTVKDKQRLALALTPTANFRVLSLPGAHVFVLWEEAGVAGENPHGHEENMQRTL